ncbi:MAG: peptide ABC transporter substrate-binding protein [Proteobacteria bacterium]|nr:peptide ABC transporter substrate-binding protein [Pseudomonadota bacterium]
MKFRMALAAAGALWLATGAAQAKDDLIIGVAQFPSSLHPNIDAEVIKGYVNAFSVRQITAYDKEWKNSCLLCTEVPTLENGLAKREKTPSGGEGLAVTIKLKPDLKWGDGVPVTAKDVAFTWKVGSDPASGFSNTNPWSRAKSVDVIDDHTIVMHLDKVRVDYAQWDHILPEHLDGPIYAAAKAPGDYIKQTTYNRDPTNPGLFDGPYRITEYKSGARIVLEPNPYWAGTKPGFKHIVIKLVENTAALQANLLSGDVDMVNGEGVGLTIDQVLALRKQYPDRFVYIFKPSLNYEHINLNRDNPILADLRVRQALLYALDRQTLVNKLFEGMQPVAATWVNPLDGMYDKSIQPLPYDPAKAKALLAEAGWKPGDDGICRNAKGDRLSIEFGTTSGNRLRELAQQVMQSQWKAACIEVTIKNEPPRTFFGETVKHRAYTGMAMFAWSSNVNASPFRTLHSSQIPTAANNWGGSNASGFSDPKMDADIVAADSELDPAKQKALWADMQQIYAANLPVLPLFFRSEAHVIPKWLKGYEPTGSSDYGAMWSENWRSE